jgi:hypothetical protein
MLQTPLPHAAGVSRWSLPRCGRLPLGAVPAHACQLATCVCSVSLRQSAAAVQGQNALFPGVDSYGMPISPLPDVRPDQPDSAKDTSGPSVAVGATPDEEVRKKAHGTFQEFLSIHDFREAEQCMRELALSVPQQGLVVATALTDSYDVQQEAEREHLRQVIVHLADAGCLVGDGLQAGVMVRLTPAAPLQPLPARARRDVRCAQRAQQPAWRAVRTGAPRTGNAW